MSRAMVQGGMAWAFTKYSRDYVEQRTSRECSSGRVSRYRATISDQVSLCV
jgi:hypothetical protein